LPPYWSRVSQSPSPFGLRLLLSGSTSDEPVLLHRCEWRVKRRFALGRVRRSTWRTATSFGRRFRLEWTPSPTMSALTVWGSFETLPTCIATSGTPIDSARVGEVHRRMIDRQVDVISRDFACHPLESPYGWRVVPYSWLLSGRRTDRGGQCPSRAGAGGGRLGRNRGGFGVISSLGSGLGWRSEDVR
jgi:hypothetical protein